MARAIFPGSFDPVTNGHVDLIRRAAEIFDHVTVAVGVNPNKRGLLDRDMRVSLLDQILGEELPGAAVTVVAFEGLLVDCAKEHGVQVIVKGLRGAKDVEVEFAQAMVNRDSSGIETLYLPSAPQFTYVSSSLVREALAVGAPIAQYVPAAVATLLSGRPASKQQPAGFTVST